MSPEQITYIIRQMLTTALEVAAPFLLLVMIVGLVVSLLQSVTHLQEMTLAFVPKMVILAVALTIFFPWMLKILTKFTSNIWVHQWEKVVSLVNTLL